MTSPFAASPATSAIPITFVTKSSWEAIRAALPPEAAQFATANGFAAKPGACLVLPAADGQIAQDSLRNDACKVSRSGVDDRRFAADFYRLGG